MEKMSLKRVSVVLCTYNGEKYIREQLESIVSFIETRIIWASIEIFGRLSKK